MNLPCGTIFKFDTKDIINPTMKLILSYVIFINKSFEIKKIMFEFRAKINFNTLYMNFC